MNKEEIKIAINKKPSELSKEELSELFGVFSLQIKEYCKSEQNVQFEVHFKRTFILRVQYPIEKGIMSFNNEFVDFGEDTHGISMGRADNMIELFNIFFNMFDDNLLSKVKYHIFFNEESYLYDSEEEHIKTFKYVQSLFK
ncbi:hypothetical protein [Dysgonomonas sp. HGC4]|uniref:hypothetical protein n=1 Tax=Dysgonomonas sp. HGC4 TaxID=1658009 RepID=UPI0006833427|nr:hypothetical protein [Dysgonomonas sp. HGC4]MBD8349373.1 hypothetical protein [Dysgonomonas sp. HGC4]